jgi:hypothetical protein
LIKQRFPFQTTKYGPAGKRLFVNIRWAKSNDRSGPRRTIELIRPFCEHFQYSKSHVERAVL